MKIMSHESPKTREKPRHEYKIGELKQQVRNYPGRVVSLDTAMNRLYIYKGMSVKEACLTPRRKGINFEEWPYYDSTFQYDVMTMASRKAGEKWGMTYSRILTVRKHLKKRKEKSDESTDNKH